MLNTRIAGVLFSVALISAFAGYQLGHNHGLVDKEREWSQYKSLGDEIIRQAARHCPEPMSWNVELPQGGGDLKWICFEKGHAMDVQLKEKKK